MNATPNPARPQTPELIIALDVPAKPDALKLAAALGGAAGFYKVGLELFTAGGPDIVRALKAQGGRVFLDLKLHDIPRQVERAVKAAAALGADLLTVHASGGGAMLRAAAEAALETGPNRPRLLAVTALTSLDASDLADIGVNRAMREHVEALGALAAGQGIDGVVCSPQEVARMRTILGPAALLVTPGIRPASATPRADDQKRTMTPAQAARAGANYIVVGRPILSARDPAAAARAILEELATARSA